jgi:flagellin-like protein
MRRKAISEIVGALIIISIVIAAGILIYVYSSGLLGPLQGARPQQGAYTNQLTLEFYDWTVVQDQTLHTVKLTLRNVGTGLPIIAAFYVNGIAATATGCTVASLTTSGTITSTTTNVVTTLLPQNSCTVTLTIPSSGSLATITPGAAYSIRVATKDGGVFTYSCIAGQRTGG